MKQQVMEFWRDEEGATAVEYALVLGLVVIAVVAAFGVFKTELTSLFTDIMDTVKTEAGKIDAPPPGPP